MSADWEFALTWLNFTYDIDIIQGKPGKRTVYADILVLEGLHHFNDRHSIQFELQHLNTKQDHGNWATGLAELTFSPHWFLAAMDQFNYVTTSPEEGVTPDKLPKLSNRSSGHSGAATVSK